MGASPRPGALRGYGRACEAGSRRPRARRGGARGRPDACRCRTTRQSPGTTTDGRTGRPGIFAGASGVLPRIRSAAFSASTIVGA